MNNNFDAVRLALALIVVCAHLCILSDVPAFQILSPYLSAEFAVKGFFTISGFLVMKSYTRSSTWKDYAEKRLRRITPAYFATIVFCLLIGWISTKLSSAEFWSHGQTLKYTLYNLLFLNFLEPNLPEVFISNKIQAMDGSLWTIKVEICLYFCIPVIAWCFYKVGTLATTLVLYGLSILWFYGFSTYATTPMAAQLSHQFPAYISYFTLGAFFAMESRVTKYIPHLLIASALLYFSKLHITISMVTEPLLIASLVVILATQTRIIIRAGKYGDLSYGIYLLHFPVIQLLSHYQLYQQQPWLWFILTIIIVGILSLISWHLIEKPMLKRSSHYIQAEKAA